MRSGVDPSRWACRSASPRLLLGVRTDIDRKATSPRSDPGSRSRPAGPEGSRRSAGRARQPRAARRPPASRSAPRHSRRSGVPRRRWTPAPPRASRVAGTAAPPRGPSRAPRASSVRAHTALRARALATEVHACALTLAPRTSDRVRLLKWESHRSGKPSPTKTGQRARAYGASAAPRRLRDELRSALHPGRLSLRAAVVIRAVSGKRARTEGLPLRSPRIDDPSSFPSTRPSAPPLAPIATRRALDITAATSSTVSAAESDAAVPAGPPRVAAIAPRSPPPWRLLPAAARRDPDRGNHDADRRKSSNAPDRPRGKAERHTGRSDRVGGKRHPPTMAATTPGRPANHRHCDGAEGGA